MTRAWTQIRGRQGDGRRGALTTNGEERKAIYEKLTKILLDNGTGNPLHLPPHAPDRATPPSFKKLQCRRRTGWLSGRAEVQVSKPTIGVCPGRGAARKRRLQSRDP